ncbi:putative reverse transcriptase domain-containing protein [Tanacetum coccineum]
MISMTLRLVFPPWRGVTQGNAKNRSRKEVSTNRVLELLHLDLIGPSSIQSYGGNFYTLVIVDDHSNYTWVVFVESKDDVLDKFKIFCKNLENLHDCSIVSIVTNHSSEFDKLQFGSFREQHGMSYNLSGPFTSQSSEIEAKKELPIIVGYMLFCIETHTPFNFAYFLEKKMDGMEFNKDPIPFARIITTLVEFIKNEYPEDDSRVMEVDDVFPIFVLVFVEAAKHQAWTIRDYCMLCATCYCDMDRGTRSVPLFVVLERDRLKALLDCKILRGDQLLVILCGYGTKSLELGTSFLSMTMLFVDHGTRSIPLFVMLSVTVSTWFDVIAMDWLSKRKFVIVCHEKVVRIPLEGDEILRVHGKRTQGVVKTLLNTKVDELKVQSGRDRREGVRLIDNRKPFGSLRFGPVVYRFEIVLKELRLEQLKVCDECLLDDGRRLGSWLFLFVQSGYACGDDRLVKSRDAEFPKDGDTVTNQTETGIDWLSKRKFVIVCHEKVVRIPLEGDEILRVHGKHTQGVVKTLLNKDGCGGELCGSRAWAVSYDLVIFCEEHQCRLLKRGAWSSFEVSVRITEEGEVDGRMRVMLARLWDDLICVALAINRRRRVKQKNVLEENGLPWERCRMVGFVMRSCIKVKAVMSKTIGLLQYLSENEIESPWILSVNFQGQSSEYDVIRVMADRLTKLAHLLAIQEDFKIIRCAPFEALYGRKCRSPVLWAEVGESSLIGPELVQETTDKVVLIKEKFKAARDRQKSYADNSRKPLEFEVGNRELLKVTPWKGVVRKKCLADASLHVPLDEIKVDKTLRFVEEPVEISDREVKRLKCSRMVVVKVHLGSKRDKFIDSKILVIVRWNSKRGPEFTWEHEDYMKSKYPQLLVKLLALTYVSVARFVLVFVEAAKHQHGLYETIVCYVLLANVIWIVVLERDRLKALVDYYYERDRLIVVDRGTCSVPLFVRLSVTVSTWFGVFACELNGAKIERSG